MKKSVFFPFLVLAGLILMIGLACGFGTPAVPTTKPVPLAPTLTDTLIPPKPTIEPTIEPTTIPQFFTEEFDQDPGSNWSLELHGSGKSQPDKLITSFENGRMRFEIGVGNLYAYYFYTPYNYTDVRLDLEVENLGVNSQNISLVCRADNNQWYEFSVGSDGMWYLYAFDNGKYETLAMAGAASLKQGHATNDYAMSCIGDEIRMYVNNTELPYSPFKPQNYYFTQGQVGFNISSIESTPVIAEVDWFKISQP